MDKLGSQIRRLGTFSAAVVTLGLASGCATTAPEAEPSFLIDATKIVDAGPAAGSRKSAIVLATVKGRTLRLKVDPGAPGLVLLNGSTAKALDLSAGEPGSYTVGPVSLQGRTHFEKVEIDGIPTVLPLLSFQHDVVNDADGVINIAHLPLPRVVIQLGAPRPAEQELRIPVHFDQERGLYHNLGLGSEVILTRFTLADPLTTATGATSSMIAKRLQGQWQGDAFTHEVRYGIRRPVRRMALGEPMLVRGLTLRELTVRFRDDLGGMSLPDESLAQVNEDDTIVVDGKRVRRSFGEAKYWLMIGSNALSGCSSLTYSARRRMITMNCLPTSGTEITRDVHPAWPADSQLAEAAETSPASAGPARPAGQELVCKRGTFVGSRLPQNICKTRIDWEQARASAQRAMDGRKSKLPNSGGGGGSEDGQ